MNNYEQKNGSPQMIGNILNKSNISEIQKRCLNRAENSEKMQDIDEEDKKITEFQKRCKERAGKIGASLSRRLETARCR